mmetsp:Transcript_539/g.1660  ORF Transcript_539/g.1660 Transcript_539/m.1660 type:complete len:228 (-) Transcript_539:9-692(-)
MIPSGDIFKGGQPTWTRWTGGKGGRRMMTRAFKVGSYVRVNYAKPQRPGPSQGTGLEQQEDIAEYEGTIVDKRMSSQDRESHVVLKDVLKLDNGRIIGYEKEKKVFDVYIEECKAVDRPDEPNAERAAAAEAAERDASNMPQCGQQVMGMGMMPMMMPMPMPMGMMAMMNPMAMNPMAMMGMAAAMSGGMRSLPGPGGGAAGSGSRGGGRAFSYSRSRSRGRNKRGG